MDEVTACGCLKDASIHELYVKNNWFCAFENCPKHSQINFIPKKESKQKESIRQLEFDF